jgi:hypothetical protein
MPPKALRRTQKLLNHFFGLGSNIWPGAQAE